MWKAYSYGPFHSYNRLRLNSIQAFFFKLTSCRSYGSCGSSHGQGPVQVALEPAVSLTCAMVELDGSKTPSCWGMSSTNCEKAPIYVVPLYRCFFWIPQFMDCDHQPTGIFSKGQLALRTCHRHRLPLVHQSWLGNPLHKCRF